MAKEDSGYILEQYKMAVASTEKVSDQRADANKFYLSVNSVIAGGLLFYSDKANPINVTTVLVASGFGVVECVIWLLALIEYRKLNSAKFKIIEKMERSLPIRFYSEEWKILNQGKWFQKYKTINKLERLLPLSFAVVYIVLLITTSRMN